MKADAHGCPESQELESFSRRALSPERVRAVETHLASCSECRAGARDEHDSAVFGRMLRDWRARMTPEDRRQTIDSATRTILRARRPDAGDSTAPGDASPSP